MDLKILEIAANTENNKIIDGFTHKSKNKNPLCGDEMEISLVVKNDKIKDIGYQCKSCVYCQASVSLLSRKIKNKEIDEIKDFLTDCEKLFENTSLEIQKKWKDFLEILNKKNIARKECLLLPIRTVLKALDIR
jgi:nitrogen fixation NifU-like protein